MKKCKKVTGIWRGSYGYSQPDTLAKRERVSFTLTIKQGWFGRFAGTVSEDAPGGMPGTGLVEGFFDFPRVEFTKQMPVGYVLSPEGRQVSVRDYLAAQGFQYDQDLPHPPIVYQGAFYDTGRIQGIWIIKPGEIPLPDGNVLPTGQASGGWNIELTSA